MNNMQHNLDFLKTMVAEGTERAERQEVKWEKANSLIRKEQLMAETERECMVVKVEELMEARKQSINIRDKHKRGNPVNDNFVRHARALLAAGGSAAATLKQLSLNARFFLNDEDYTQFQQDLPKTRWFQYQREGLGMESHLYNLTRISKCDRVLQWGFDETSLDGVATLNQWVRIQEGEDLHTLTLECGGLLPGSTANKVALHVRLFWQRGEEAITMLREELGDKADALVPVVNGGISLSKIGGVMHDTCNCANVIARKVRVLRDKSGEDLYGVDEWKQMSRQEHAWCDYFCGNHSRNLHFDAFGRLFEAYIKRNLGAALDAARQKSGGRVRVEASGEAYYERSANLRILVQNNMLKVQFCFLLVVISFLNVWP